ncbi:MAG: hypothetical protein ACR2RL_07485 [Gammaproteobacteria bacterium]
MTDFEALLSAGEPAQLEIATLDDSQQAVRALAASARHSIDIVSRALDPRLYDDARFISAVRAFLLGSREARLRVLIRNPDTVVQARHRLLGLAYQLTSYCELRQFGADHAEHNTAIIIVDERSCLQHPLSDRYEGHFAAKHRGLVREHARLFEEMWAVGQLNPNLRRLAI